MNRVGLVAIAMALGVPLAGGASARQLDQEKAALYFKEAAALCAREGGQLWGVSLCGPIAIGDPVSKAIATNEPAPDARPPAALGFANAAFEWGGKRWTTLSWPMMPADERLRARLMVHELFHRVQPQLGLFVSD